MLAVLPNMVFKHLFKVGGVLLSRVKARNTSGAGKTSMAERRKEVVR